MESTQNELVRVINNAGVEQSTANMLQTAFIPFFDQANEWKTKAESLVVTDISQTREMQMARQARLALKDIRVQADKKRKELKEDSLRYGKAVQGVYNVIEYLIAPIEKHLEDQEKFAERQEERRIAVLQEERLAMLQPYLEFVPYATNYGALTDDAWQKMYTGAKLQHEAKIEAERKAEAERIAREKAEAEERERIRQENERLKAEASKAEAERIAAEKKAAEELRKAQEEADRILKEERRIAAEKMAKEQEEARRLAAELKAKEDEARAERDRIAKAEAERIAAEKKAAKAPDKEKLAKWVDSFSIGEITVKSPEANECANSIAAKFAAFKTWAQTLIQTI